MFEDSLVESQNRIRTRSKWFAIGSLVAQMALLLLLIAIPLIHPQALPKQSLARLLVAPPPPRAAAPVAARQQTPARSNETLPSIQALLQAPSNTPSSISTSTDAEEPPSGYIGSILGGVPDGLPAGIPLGAPPPVVVAARPAVPGHPLSISSGVAAGQLLSPIRPTYPAIAKAARIQGTVLLEATISLQGAIENLRVVEGPPMLRQAALDAVAAARYRPFQLNGEPVEVQTNIRVIFSLGE
jgi:protein TonB